MRLPQGVLDMADRGPDWAHWVDRLPRLIRDLLEQWQLQPDGAPMHGYCALVLPVRTPGSTPAVLKVAMPDEESEHEHLALQRWGGEGAVRLLRADPGRRAMLLERLHPEDLSELWDVEACQIVGSLYRQLHVPASPQFRPVTGFVQRWLGALERMPRDAPIPHRMVEQTLSLGKDLIADNSESASDPDRTNQLLHGDLHYANVLAGDREPWLAIDPKAMAGDPHYEPAPMLWNRFEELEGDVRRGLRARFHAIIDAAELDEDRARDWVVVRMILNAHWTVQDADAASRALAPGEREWITRCIAIAKVVQD